jgi:DNA-binding transcriptional regulator YiaG
VPGDVLDLTYDDKEGKWKLADLKEGEELDTTKLNELKTALDDLKIVDVRRKPAGLSRDLKTEEGINLDEPTLASLISKGYYPTQSGDLLSNEGEIVVGTKEGVQYVLRFGETALGTEQTGEDGGTSPTEGSGGETPPKEKGANRYLFLMAQFDPALLAKPELTPIPGEEGAPAAESAQPAADAPSSGEAPAEATNTDEAAPGEQAPSEGPSAPEGEAVVRGGESAEETGADDVQSEKAATGEAATGLPPKSAEQIEAIRAENKRKQDEFEQKIKAGQAKVKELNDRFADWYYVISDDIYKKIKLHRPDVLKKPEGAAEKDSPAEFDQLKQGLNTGTP